jgi:nucleoside-diphosphate-sugar epimerase
MLLVTGCAGFIGSHLSEELTAKGYEVLGIDNFDPYYSASIKKKNLTFLRKNKKFKFLKIDIGNSRIKKYLKDIDTVYHLAARPGVRPSLKNPFTYHRINTSATLNLLSACSNIENFVFASSSSVYGDVSLDKLPVRETNVPQPISPYAASKLAAEAHCSAFGGIHGIPVAILRYFTVYGPRQRPDEAVCKFTSLLLQGKRPKIYGDGKQTRDFTFVTDIVNGTILAGEKKVDGIYNLGSGRRISINKLVELLIKYCEVEKEPEYVNKKPGDVKHTWADISKAKRDFGYRPKFSIEEGIKIFVDWFKENNI